MDIKQLRHLVAVVEHGNILRAAGAIHISQPALSKSLRNLERSLGVKLLERGPGGVRPTPYGDKLYAHAKLIVNQARQAEEDVRSYVDGVQGHVRIGMGASFAGFMLPRAVMSVLESRPGLTASIISKPFDELAPLLRQGEIDLILVVFPPDPPEPEFTYEPLIISEFHTVCRPAHPLAGRGTVPVADLARESWILFDRPQTMHALFNTIFLDRDLVPPQPAVRTSSVFFLKAALRHAALLSFVPPGLVYDELVGGALVSLPTEMPSIRIKAGIIYRSNDILPPGVLQVVEELRRLRDRLDTPGVMTPVDTPAAAPPG